MDFKPRGMPTAIGSMPHTDPEAAARFVLDTFKEIPFWPQLPRVSFDQNMYAQWVQDMPGVIIDRDRERLLFETDTPIDDAIERFNERVAADDAALFKPRDEAVSGLLALVNAVQKNGAGGFALLKGQLTGPISLGLAITDENKNPLIYQEILPEIMTKTLAMQARWQEELLGRIAGRANTLVFLDEPTLMCYGSAYLSLERERVIELLSDVLGSLRGLKGAHCCGNTDWGLLLDSPIDVLSFDALDYADEFSTYSGRLGKFLENGGMIAWGIVPTSVADGLPSAKELLGLLEDRMKVVADQGPDLDVIRETSLITPNCGTATLPVAAAEKVHELTCDVSTLFRGKYFS